MRTGLLVTLEWLNILKCWGGLSLGMSCLDKLPDPRDEDCGQWFYYMHTKEGGGFINFKKKMHFINNERLTSLGDGQKASFDH